MNETVKEILGILDGGRPDLQVAAAQILGELQLKDPAIVRSLAAGAARSHVLGRYVLEALWRIGTPEALRVVVRILIEHDGLIDQASHVLGESGAAAHAAIGEAFTEAPPDRRLRLLQVLAKAPGKDTVRPFVQALVTPEISEAAAKVVLGSVEAMSVGLRKALHGSLSQVLDQPLPEACVAAVLGVVAKVDPHGAKVLLLHHASEKSTTPVRLAALRSLSGQQFTGLQCKVFLSQLEDPAEHAVHETVRDVLTAMPEWPEGLVPQLKRFMTSRNVEQRLFALRAMRSSPSADLVRQALKLRGHDDPRFRAAAEDVLAGSRQAIDPVLRLLQLTKDPGEAQRLAGILARQGASMPPRQLRALAERAIKVLPTKSFVADHLLDVVIAAAGPKLVPFFLERALRWRRSRRFAEALHVLAKLASAKLLDGEGRYQLAVTRFLQDAVRPGAEGATPGNAAMGFFTSLLRDGFPLLDRLKKDTSMPPEQQLRLATYFADTVGAERRFGAELLQLLAARHKGRTGEEARHALRAVGY